MYDQNPPQRLRNKRPLLFQIPEEILNDEILPRLPVKSLSRFKCVSKSWRSLIESTRFMKIQYWNSAKNPRVIFSNLYSMKECSLQSLLNSKEGSDPTMNEVMPGNLVGCSNGVVCCYDLGCIDGRFWLWNLAIRVRIELPDSGGRYVGKRGFGWDESSGAYKVFVVLSDLKSYELIGRVYSSNTNSWRTIPCGSLSLISPSGMFLRGNLHWIDSGHSQIECFDFEREEFGRIELPLKNYSITLPFPFPVLGEIGRRLSILYDLKKTLEVWVMKEYGVKDSWFKLLTFPPRIIVFDPKVFACFPLFGEGPNGEIFVCRGENLAVYSPKDNAFSTARNYVDSIVARLYVESLVSPKRMLDATNTTW